MPNFNDIPTGLRVPSQIPLDIKEYFATLEDMLDLGTNNNKAFTYYKGFRAYCVENENIYIWREAVPELGLGLLPSNFTYPNGTECFGVDYSNKEYNFFLKPETLDLVSIGSGAKVYKGYNDLLNRHEFRSLVSNSVSIQEEENMIRLEIPSTFQGIDYYVNNNYTGTEELGTASKPFKNLTNCIDKILNRGAFQDPLVNGGNEYQKWDLRTGLSDGAVRVIIQSYTETNENIAINRVEYFLERGGSESQISVPSTGAGANLEYILDMKELVDNVPKFLGQLPYELKCAITGKGTLAFYESHTQRKGFVRAYGFNNGTMSLEQPDSNLFFGSVGGYINCLMYKKPTLTYTPLYSDAGNTIPIKREGIDMTGYQTSSVPDYGAIQVEKANAQFKESLFLNGTIEVNCFEQHLFYAKDYGAAYGDNGRIYIRRNYQHINYSTIEYIDINPYTPDVKKFYKPSTHIYDFYLKDGAILSYAGDIYAQENTAYIQGGSEAFVCLENTTTDTNLFCSFNANGGGRIPNLFYNHYIKSILNPVFDNYQHHSIALKNLKITSNPFEEVISVVDTSDNDWTKIVTIGNFIDTVLQDYLVGGLIRLPFSNLTVNDKLFIIGTTIGLYKGMLNSNLPQYKDDDEALSDGYPVGGIYKDLYGGLRIVI